MIFPGQSIQNINQILHLNKYNHVIKNTFDEASEYLHYNIWKNIQKKKYIIKKQGYAQPILITIAVAIYRFWKKISGKNPHIVSGHSLGEYSALICSDAIKFSEGLLLVQRREHMMKKNSSSLEIQMQAIIGLSKNIIVEILKKNHLIKFISIASINSKNQVIISGYKKPVEKINITLEALGAIIIPLKIDVAAHCFIMKKIYRKFSKQIKKILIKKTKYPVINSTIIKKQNKSDTIQKNFIKQLSHPVQWEKTMHIITLTSDIILEISTNNVLKKICKDNNYINIISINNFKNIKLTLNLLK